MRTTSKAVEDTNAASVPAAARRLARRLGNPTPALSRTLHAGQQLLSMAATLPATAPDPFAALRRLLQAPLRSGRSALRGERTTPREPSVRSAGPVRESGTAPPATRSTRTAPTSTTRTPTATLAGKATAAARDTGAARAVVSSITPTDSGAALERARLQQRTPAAATSSGAASAPLQPLPVSQHAAASREVLAQRRRSLRDRLETRTPGAAMPAAPHGAAQGVASIATPAALLGFAWATTGSAAALETEVPPATPPVPGAPAAAQRSVPTPASLGTGSERAAALPGSSVSPQGLTADARSTARPAAPVRRQLPQGSPRAGSGDAFGDLPADTLLDAAHRHGVDPA